MFFLFHLSFAVQENKHTKKLMWMEVHICSVNDNPTGKSTEYSVLFQYSVKVAVFLEAFPIAVTVPLFFV